MSKIDYNNLTEEEQIEVIKQNYSAIQHIKNHSEAVQLAAVQQEGSMIQYIKNPSEELKLEAVKQNGWAIKYIENPSEVVQLAAVKQDWSSIEYITNPSEAVQLAAVKIYGRSIVYITNPSEAVQLAAVQQDGLAISYTVYNPSEAVELAAVQQNGLAIEYITNPSEAVQLAAVQQNGLAIKLIKTPSEAVQLAAANVEDDKWLKSIRAEKQSRFTDMLNLVKTSMGADKEETDVSLTERFYPEEALTTLKSCGGFFEVLAEAGLLYLKKSKDYNSKIELSQYFPFGVISYAQMIHVKAARFNSLVEKELLGEEVNYEGLRDTALDIMNYAAFYILSTNNSGVKR